MSVRDFSERDIHLGLDGELPEDDRRDFDAWLRANPDMLARRDRFAGDMTALRESLCSVVNEPVPQRLASILSPDGAAGRPLVHRGVWRMAAAAAILLAGLAGGYAVGASGWHPNGRPALWIADSAIAAHNVFAAEKLHVVEVGADQRQHLLGWLSHRVGLTLAAPDLSGQGFDLVGGRILPVENRAAAQLMYQDAEGNRVSLLVARDPSNGDTGFRSTEESGTRAMYWLDDGYGCAITGSIPEATLKAIAEIAYKQLLEHMEG